MTCLKNHGKNDLKSKRYLRYGNRTDHQTQPDNQKPTRPYKNSQETDNSQLLKQPTSCKILDKTYMNSKSYLHYGNRNDHQTQADQQTPTRATNHKPKTGSSERLKLPSSKMLSKKYLSSTSFLHYSNRNNHLTQANHQKPIRTSKNNQKN